MKELHLVEGRNIGIPTAIKAIRENNSPPPIFLTDDQRSFFSVIVPIHESFIENEKEPPKKSRRSKNEIKQFILETLNENNMSMNQLYYELGYSGNPSKSFSACVNDLIREDAIKYSDKSKHSSTSVLILNPKRRK